MKVATVRLDKMLSNAGYGSRKEIKQILRDGYVTVNGEVCLRPETKIHTDSQEVHIDGISVAAESLHYYMLNKPAGVISATFDANGEETVIDLLDDDVAAESLFPVGRLDKDTVGLLILTNDGIYAHKALSPKRHVPKTYHATVIGTLTEADVQAFEQGIALEDGYVCKTAVLRIISAGETSQAEVIITEGKYHQVKRMFAARGKTVTYLRRVSFGGLRLDESLAEGEYRYLTEAEVRMVLLGE